jgi:hypothetical protein
MDADVIIVEWRSMQRIISGVPTREPGHVSTGFARIDPTNGRLIASGEGEPSTPGTAEREILGGSAAPRCASDDLVAAIQYDGDEAGCGVGTRLANHCRMLDCSMAGLHFEIFPAIADISWQARKPMEGTGKSTPWLPGSA